MKQKFWILLSSVCVFAVSCGQAPQKAINSEYELLTISPGNKTLHSDYSASVRGIQDVEVRPQVSGTITQVCISEGATVKKGQTLFIIDQVPYQAALQTALANVESANSAVATAELTANSKQVLFDQAVVSEFDLQTAKNNLRSQKAALSQTKAQEINARNNLSYTAVKSPSDGVAGMIPYRVGALVNSAIAQPLVTISDNNQMYAYFSMTEKQVLVLTRQSGTLGSAMDSMPQVELILNDGSLYSEKGKIDAISGIIDPVTGAVSVRAIFENPAKILRSGGAANVRMPYDKKGSIIIPQAATYEIQDRLFVYKVVDSKAVATPITVFAVNDGSDYVVEQGLAPGDVIVAQGAGLLRDGAPVTERKKAAEAAPAAVEKK